MSYTSVLCNAVNVLVLFCTVLLDKDVFSPPYDRESLCTTDQTELLVMFTAESV